jgi:hypothetical protein
MKDKTKKNLKVAGGTAVAIGLLWWILSDMGFAVGRRSGGSKPLAGSKTIRLKVDGLGCSVEDGDRVDCSTICDDSRFAGMTSVIIDAKDGPHGVVETVIDCLKGQGLKVSVIRN